jgi:hypothetical protein
MKINFSLRIAVNRNIVLSRRKRVSYLNKKSLRRSNCLLRLIKGIWLLRFILVLLKVRGERMKRMRRMKIIKLLSLRRISCLLGTLPVMLNE